MLQRLYSDKKLKQGKGNLVRRHCDGTDPNLIMFINKNTGKAIGQGTPVILSEEKTVPCDCGKVFDDVHYMVIWPHLPV